jgi:lysyl-tRNA synthetase class 2
MNYQEILYRLQMQKETLRQVRDFFDSRGFVEIPFVPMVTRFPGQEPNLDPMEVQVKLVHPSREVQAGLITSPEYAMKKLMGAGMDKIYTITPVFRNMEADGGNHGPEFLMLEWYARGDYADLMVETEAFLKAILQSDESWRRVNYDQAEMIDGEPKISEEKFFVTDFPAEEASLARIGENGRAERFEAFARLQVSGQSNLLELCNGFCELTDATEQRARFKQEQAERREAGKTVFPIDEELLTAISRIEGPIYGNALGLDRLMMLKYGVGDINSVQIFPFNDRY